MQEQAGFWLSPQQANLWSAQERGACNATLRLEFASGVGEAQVRDALAAAVRRHEALRTVFRAVPGMKFPFQVVLPEGPPVDAHWIPLESGRHQLLLRLPSLLSDVASLKILARELQAEPAELPEPALRYVQFAQWQRDLLEPGEDDPEQTEGKAYWEKLKDTAAVPALPEDRRLAESAQLASFDVTVGFDVEGAAEREEVSLEIFLLAAWHSLIHKLSGQAAFVTGVSFPGREYEELTDLVGAVARTVPIAAGFEGSTSFRHVLRDLRDAFKNASKLQEYYSPELLANEVSAVVFDYADITEPGIVSIEAPAEIALLRLSARRATDLKLQFTFDESRLRRQTVERWSNYFLTLLEAATQNPAIEVAALPWLSAEEKQTLIETWNHTRADYPHTQTISALIEEQASRTPGHTAVRCEDRTLTYTQLNESANQLAHALRKAGVTAGSLVGLCVDRGERMIVALLGILKAGGAYVPLSHEHPRPRLAQQLNGASALVVDEKFLPNMPEFPGVTLTSWSEYPTENPAPAAGPQDLVYVIYTSGSTGTPKGVGVRHRNLVNYSWFIRNLLRLESFPQGLHFGLVSTLSADLGNTCIFPSLISGGCLHVIPHDMATDPQRFAAYCEQNPIDVLKIVPSHLAALLESNTILPRKYLITGGELLTVELVEKIAALEPACEIINHYGPTETTVGSLTLRLEDYDLETSSARGIPIGSPIANTRIYILDSCGEAVPVGVTGELFIAGDGVASGYIGKPELTAERFLPEAFQSDPELRMYRTGDLARYLPDGNVEFLGRSDDQVKVRGFRIELAEIETVALQVPGLKRMVVLPREDRLIAWFTGTANIDELRAHLKQNLPDYMVPAAFVPVPRFPLNANGKIDRQALPSPEESESAKRAWVAPEGIVEEATAAIWSDVLRRDRIGAEDDFFEIGGHSLLATRIVSRLREHFRVSVTVRMVFEKPTVRQLAAAIAAARLEEAAGDEGDDEFDDFDLVSKQDSRG